MNEKLGHLSHAEAEKTEALENVEDEKQNIINEFIAKDQINKQEKEVFIQQLQEKEREMAQLKRELRNLERERMMLRERNIEVGNTSLNLRIEKALAMCEDNELFAILEGDISRLSKKTRMYLSDFGITPTELLNSDEFRYAVRKRMRNSNAHGSMMENNN